MDVASAIQARLAQGAATGYCHLNGLGLNRVPDEVFALTNLVRLDLSSNELSTISPKIAQLSRLEHLWLRDNPLQQLPPPIARCRALRVLDVSNTRLVDLPRELGPLRRVLEIDTSDTPFQAARRAAGTSSLMQTLAAKDTEQRLRKKLANKLREGLYREYVDTEEGRAAVSKVVDQVFFHFKRVEEQRSFVRNAERLLPEDPYSVDAASMHRTFTDLQRRNQMKRLAAEVELKLRALYFDRIRPERVEGIVQGLYAHITVLEDIKFMLRHASEVFPESWEDIDPKQVKASLYELRDRLRAERRAAVEAMLKSLRALYADTEPALVNDTGEQVAKRFRKVDEIKKLGADCSKYFPSEFREVDPDSVRAAFAKDLEATQALLGGTGTASKFGGSARSSAKSSRRG